MIQNKQNKETKINGYIYNINEGYIDLSSNRYNQNNHEYNKVININIKVKFLLFFIFVFLLIIILVGDLYTSSNENHKILKLFKNYINNCKNSIKYNRIIIKSEIPYISICLSALNMENYIKQNILSILNESFQDFEIIIINDNSSDKTELIIKEIQIDDDRIKIINHNENFGVYRSRIESILNSKGKNILLMDPDDMYLNENLFLELYNYNKINNLDIIEFTVYQQIDGSRKIIYPDNLNVFIEYIYYKSNFLIKKR